MIIIDYETRSKVDLTVVGAHNYARHPSTEILFLALYDEKTDENIVFDPYVMDMPEVWVKKLRKADYVGAVNATFDRLIHEYCGLNLAFPIVPFDKWYCISAQMRINALPANLEDGAKAAKVADLKNPRGKQLIKLLCMPQEDGKFNEDPALMSEMQDYCLDDAIAAVAIYRATRPMMAIEHQDWLICERMNEKGVKIDRTLAMLATSYAHAEQAEISAEIVKVTGGAVERPTQYQRIKKYILDAIGVSKNRNDVALRRMMEKHVKGGKKISLDKDAREAIITAIDEGNLNLYEDIEELIRLLDAASASSVAKFAKMVELASPADDRVRGAFIHAGASQTHRYSSKGLQMHNMKRKCYTAEEAEQMKSAMVNEVQLNNVMQSLSKLLRPAIIPDKHKKFVVGDWSAIEARALPWLSGEKSAEKKLDLFRQGIDTYIEAAKGIFNRNDIDEDSDERQAGKVAELSLGFGGSNGAFNSMAANYGVVLPDHMVTRIVKTWRRDNPWAVKFWSNLEKAAKNAIRKRGTQSFSAGRVTYHFAPQLLGGTLICELPDGTCIQYPFARIEHTDKGDGIVALKAGIKPKADGSTKGHWGSVRLWGGLLSENVTQAFCAALLRDKLRTCYIWKLPVVLHVHDEIALESEYEYCEEDRDSLKEIMEEVPLYATGLPLKANPVILDRYGNH